MKIREGYDSKETQIRIAAHAAKPKRIAEVWIEQEGVDRYSLSTPGGATHPTDNTYTKIEGHSETLAYITLEELLELRDECNEAIKALVA